MNYFEILGVQPGASPDEIRHAYARLIRKYSPENAPEEFQKIRDAYEHLRNGDVSSDTQVPAPSEPEAQWYVKRINHAVQTADWPLVAVLGETAVLSFPRSEYFLYYLAQAYVENGQPEKAVKTAESLFAAHPSKPAYALLVYNTLLPQGWSTRLMKAAKTAFKLGCRDTDFVQSYVRFYQDRRQFKEMTTLLLGVIKEPHIEGQAQLDLVVWAYRKLISYLEYTEKNIPRIVKSFRAFIAEHGAKVLTTENATQLLDSISATIRYLPHESLVHISDLLVILHDSCRGTIRSSIAKKAILQEEFVMRYGEPETRTIRYFMTSFIYDPDFVESPLIFEEDEEVHRLDATLCIISDRAKILPQMDRLRKTYPFFADEVQALLDKTADDASAAALKQETMVRLFKLTPPNTTNFYDWFPGERKSQNQAAYGHASSYQGRRSKISKNAPCPCGSGKKFKMCCMGKGIYD